jgi:hypothetical protein
MLRGLESDRTRLGRSRRQDPERTTEEPDKIIIIHDLPSSKPSQYVISAIHPALEDILYCVWRKVFSDLFERASAVLERLDIEIRAVFGGPNGFVLRRFTPE